MKRGIDWFLFKGRGERGATAVLVALLLVVLLGIAALSIDLGYLFTTRNELQNIADGAALAAARKLGSIYQPMDYAQQQAYVCDPAPIVAVAQELAAKNTSLGMAAGAGVSIAANDVIIGRWSDWKGGGAKTENLDQPDAVNVTVRRDGLVNSAVATIFARVLGVNSVTVSATATAALTGQSTAGPGDLQLPIGISKYWFDNNTCKDEIKFSPTNDTDSCAGWTSFLYNSSDSTVRQILEENPDYTSPEIQADQTQINFTGGDLSKNTFDDFLTLFQHNGYDVNSEGDPILDADGNPMVDAGNQGVPLYDADGNRLTYPDGTPRNEHIWQTTVAVYDSEDCSNPNTSLEVVGFARVIINDVLGPPDKLIKGQVLCNYVSGHSERGGGGTYGVKGSIPNLVE